MSPTPRSRYVLLAASILLLCVVAVPARADSVAYNISGSFSSGSHSQYFGGVLDWNAATHQVTGYSLTLGNSTFTCSGFCNFVFKGFRGPGYHELLIGYFNPKDTTFTLEAWGRGGRFGGTIKDMAWTQVSVPDAPAMAELLGVLALFGLMIPRARVLRRQS